MIEVNVKEGCARLCAKYADFCDEPAAPFRSSIVKLVANLDKIWLLKEAPESVWRAL